MNPMVPSLSSRKLSELDEETKAEFKKMSASMEDSKIDLLDSSASLTRKIGKVFCEEGSILNNSTFPTFCIPHLHSFANLILIG